MRRWPGAARLPPGRLAAAPAGPACGAGLVGVALVGVARGGVGLVRLRRVVGSGRLRGRALSSGLAQPRGRAATALAAGARAPASHYSLRALARHLRAMPNSVSVVEISIPVARLRGLSDEQRYTYYLLGLVFNELICLRKLISFSFQQRGDDMRPVRLNPETSQTLLLFRLACAKVYEARKKLNSKEVSTVLRRDVWPHWPKGADVLKSVNKAVADADWITRVRNGIGFHYPEMAEWKPFITPTDQWVDDVIFAGPETGNHFYDASESVARHHMFGFEAAMDAKQVRRIVEEMIELLGKMCELVDGCISCFVAEHLVDARSVGRKVHSVSAPKYSAQRIPFWTEMSSMKKQKLRQRSPLRSKG